jgi:hypothetical protein
MKAMRGHPEQFIFSLITKCMPHDTDMNESENAVSDRLFYFWLAFAAVVTVVLALLKFGLLG